MVSRLDDSQWAFIGLEPYKYLHTLLIQLPYAETIEQIEALLPWTPKAIKSSLSAYDLPGIEQMPNKCLLTLG
ncbi:transposase domain-containing protein [Vibrio rotiferianus]|uniref:transposase domain-containing protein n=1 Tax=Vibrio rotiferianus TaxID=190895 RepID=UPI003981737C